MNPDLQNLQPYPFEKLAALKSGYNPPTELGHIALSIGEPKHETPEFITNAITANLEGFNRYPLTRGTDQLREAISSWLTKRFKLNGNSLNADKHVLPVNGTREALFAFAQSVVDRTQNPAILMPNPFYQIYEGAALLAGAEPVYLNTLEQNDFLIDYQSVSEADWQRCQLLYLCTPGNPTGAVMSLQDLQSLIILADKYDFIIASDECYSELYTEEDNPPVGLLQACSSMGRDGFNRCVVFHSLSKRSNAPGLRSGFVAGDAEIIKKFLLFRTYHGCAMPLPIQMASIQAWQDEKHVITNRQWYREKFTTVHQLLSPVLDIDIPAGAFYLWIKTPVSDTEFAQRLFEQQNVTVLPGSFLSRESNGINPGINRIRVALVADKQECTTAAKRIRQFVETL